MQQARIDIAMPRGLRHVVENNLRVMNDRAKIGEVSYGGVPTLSIVQVDPSPPLESAATPEPQTSSSRRKGAERDLVPGKLRHEYNQAIEKEDYEAAEVMHARIKMIELKVRASKSLIAL